MAKQWYHNSEDKSIYIEGEPPEGFYAWKME